MKYIITASSIVVSNDGITTIIDKSNKAFDRVKNALETGSEDIAYVLNKDVIDKAKELLSKTGGNLLPEEMA